LLYIFLKCNVTTNSHTCETMAYTASAVLRNRLNVQAAGHIHPTVRQSRWR